MMHLVKNDLSFAFNDTYREHEDDLQIGILSSKSPKILHQNLFF